MMPSKSVLSEKQKMFCHEYIVDLNATQAAIRAGYSKKTANEQGSRLLANVKVQQYVYKINQERIKRVEIDADFVLKEHHNLANTDIADLFSKEDGTLLNIHDVPVTIRKAIQSFEVEETHIHDSETGEVEKTTKLAKIKLWSKDKNLENLGRHLKLYTDKHEVSGSVGLADRMSKARKRTSND